MSQGQPDTEPLARRFDLLANAPGWLLSAGIHVLVLLVAMFLYVEENIDVEQGEGRIVLHPPAPPPIQALIRPRDVIDRRGIPLEDPVLSPVEPCWSVCNLTRNEWDGMGSDDALYGGSGPGRGLGVDDDMGIGSGGGRGCGGIDLHRLGAHDRIGYAPHRYY